MPISLWVSDCNKTWFFCMVRPDKGRNSPDNLGACTCYCPHVQMLVDKTSPFVNFRAAIGGQLSNLVALTTSIGDDLMQLETGYHNLIDRVHANCLELNKANSRLGFVWDTKDNNRDPEKAQYDESCDADENQFLDWSGSNGMSFGVSIN